MNGRVKYLYLVALLLPLVFLGVETASHLWHRATAPVYRVAVEGYDPRDLVYGEYLQFRILWDDPRSQKPETGTSADWPATARVYLPEGHAWDLQSMLFERRHAFTADVTVKGRTARAHDVYIDGLPWRIGLEAWRTRRDSVQ